MILWSPSCNTVSFAAFIIGEWIGVGFGQRVGLHAASRRAAQLVSGAQGCLEGSVGARVMAGWFIQLTCALIGIFVRDVRHGLRSRRPGLQVSAASKLRSVESIAESIYRKECDHNKPVIVCVCKIFLQFSAAAFHLMRHFREAPEYLGRVGWWS